MEVALRSGAHPEQGSRQEAQQGQEGRQGSLGPLAGVSLPWETPCPGVNLLLLQIGSSISACSSRHGAPGT